MGENSKIEWTDHTWNPWVGCTKVSPACEHCYMFEGMKRTGQNPNNVRKTVAKALPLKRDRQRQFKVKPGQKVFPCSWSDWFHKAADEWRPAAWDVIRQRPDVTFQIVTKRIERAAQCLPPDWGNGWPNAWLIVTAENQHWLEKRVSHLMQIPAAVRGLSIEPLLGPVDLSPWMHGEVECEECDCGIDLDGLECLECNGRGEMPADTCIDWVIVGGESGPHARPMNPQWVRDIRDQCQSAGVPFFFKQWGRFKPCEQSVRSEDGPILSAAFHSDGTKAPSNVPLNRIPGVFCMWDCGANKSRAGRTLDGREWSEFPSVEAVH